MPRSVFVAPIVTFLSRFVEDARLVPTGQNQDTGEVGLGAAR